MRVVAIAVGVLALLVAIMSHNVWWASDQPVTHTPGTLETARTQLHAQLEQARTTEAAAEKQDWNSSTGLRALIQGHQQRIEKLKGNSEAAEILAYDRDAIDRLEKRIAQLTEQAAAKAKEQESQP